MRDLAQYAECFITNIAILNFLIFVILDVVVISQETACVLSEYTLGIRRQADIATTRTESHVRRDSGQILFVFTGGLYSHSG